MQQTRKDDLFGDLYEHPSFGKLTFGRSQGGDSVLFGSSIKHRNTIRMTISHAEYNRHTGYEFIFERGRILEAEMSPTQFADAISGIGSSTGTPITLKYIKGGEMIESPEFINKREQFESEFLRTIGGISKRLIDLEQQVKDKHLPKWVSHEIEIIRSWLKSNAPFLAEQFDEQMDKSVTEAKGELEAYISGMVEKLGLEALREQTPLLPDGKENSDE